MSGTLNFTLKVWRQNGPKDNGHFEEYESISDDFHDFGHFASFPML